MRVTCVSGITIEPGLDPLTLSQRTIVKMRGTFSGYCASLTPRGVQHGKERDRVGWAPVIPSLSQALITSW